MHPRPKELARLAGHRVEVGGLIIGTGSECLFAPQLTELSENLRITLKLAGGRASDHSTAEFARQHGQCDEDDHRREDYVHGALVRREPHRRARANHAPGQAPRDQYGR